VVRNQNIVIFGISDLGNEVGANQKEINPAIDLLRATFGLHVDA